MRGLHRGIGVDQVPRKPLYLGFLGRRNEMARRRTQLRKQLGEVGRHRATQVYFIEIAVQSHFDLRSGDAIGLVDFPGDEEQGGDDADHTDDFDEFAQMPVVHGGSVRASKA